MQKEVKNTERSKKAGFLLKKMQANTSEKNFKK